MQVWRISKRKYALTAFSKEGTRLVGGRWTFQGVSAVYSSSSLALAALELLVHLNKEDVTTEFVAIAAEVPNDLATEVITSEQLPKNWRETPAPVAVAAIGYEWLKTGRTAVLSIPSAVIPVERNFLLNPSHPDFARIQIKKPEAFSFDIRLL